MGFRFFRRMQIAPGVRLNFSKTGISPSIGVRGARMTLGRKGARTTVGIPGTGLFYTDVAGTKSRGGRSGAGAVSPPAAGHKLDLGFFGRLFTPKPERAFVDGCKAYVAGDEAKAAEELARAAHLADAAFLAGFLALGANRLDAAERLLRKAASKHTSLGDLFAKYGLAVELALPITEFVVAHIRPCRRGALLGLAEIYQMRNRLEEALDCLEEIRRDAPDDIIVKLSVAELLLEAAPDDRETAKEVVALVGEVDNDSTAHAALMLFKAQALRTLGLHTAARDVLTAASRKKKDRDEELLLAVRYERACVYEDLGQKANARREFEKLYASDPSFEDVAERLGV